MVSFTESIAELAQTAKSKPELRRLWYGKCVVLWYGKCVALWYGKYVVLWYGKWVVLGMVSV